MTRLSVEVLEIFAEAQGMVPRRIATEEGGIEACRAAYRERQRARGLCVSCRRPAERGRKSCAVHLARAKARARKSNPPSFTRGSYRRFRERRAA